MSRAARPRPARRRPARRDAPAEQQYFVIGQVVAPRGLRGEVKVRVETDDPGRFADLDDVYVGDRRERYAVVGSRLFKGYALIMLEGVDDRDAAEELRGAVLYVRAEDALPLADGEYYFHQIEGLRVVDESGAELGRVSDVLTTGANDVYVIAGPTGELLLPAIKDVILAIDIAGGTMTVRVPEGLA